MDGLANNIGVIAPALAALLTVFVSWQINKRQAKTAAKEGDAKVLRLQSEIAEQLWKRAKAELDEKEAEIKELKTALNLLGIENHTLKQRVQSLEIRLGTGEFKRD